MTNFDFNMVHCTHKHPLLVGQPSAPGRERGRGEEGMTGRQLGGEGEMKLTHRVQYTVLHYDLTPSLPHPHTLTEVTPASPQRRKGSLKDKHKVQDSHTPTNSPKVGDVIVTSSTIIHYYCHH